MFPGCSDRNPWLLLWITLWSLWTPALTEPFIAPSEPLDFPQAYHYCHEHGAHLLTLDERDALQEDNRTLWLNGFGWKQGWHWTDEAAFSDSECTDPQTTFTYFEYKAYPGTQEKVIKACSQYCHSKRRTDFQYILIDRENTTQCSCLSVVYKIPGHITSFCEECKLQGLKPEEPCKEEKVYFIGDKAAGWSPQAFISDGKCGSVTRIIESEPKLVVRRTPCSEQLSYICSNSKEPKATTYMGWTDAKNLCVEKGGDLLHITEQLVNDAGIEDYTPYWIGLTSLPWHLFQQESGRFQYTTVDMLPEPPHNLSCLFMEPSGAVSSGDCCQPRNFPCHTGKRGRHVEDLDGAIPYVCGNTSFPTYTDGIHATTGRTALEIFGIVLAAVVAALLFVVLVLTILHIIGIIDIWDLIKRCWCKEDPKETPGSASPVNNKEMVPFTGRTRTGSADSGLGTKTSEESSPFKPSVGQDSQDDQDDQDESPYAVSETPRPRPGLAHSPARGRESGVSIVECDVYASNKPASQKHDPLRDVYAEPDKSKKSKPQSLREPDVYAEPDKSWKGKPQTPVRPVMTAPTRNRPGDKMVDDAGGGAVTVKPLVPQRPAYGLEHI